MRLSNLSLLLGVVSRVAATLPPVIEDEDDGVEPTIFNGKSVPPVLELTPKNWEEKLKASKFLMVKHFSPYCPHCADFAPTYQTIYEFYYTSSASGRADDKAPFNFTQFYDFQFASINCVAFNDLCTKNDVRSWPTTIIFKDGQPAESVKGARDIRTISDAMEKALEEAKPGSRPKKIDLPAPGDTSSPGFGGKPLPASTELDEADEDHIGSAPAEKVVAEKGTVEKIPPAQKGALEKPAAEKTPTEKAPAEKAAVDQTTRPVVIPNPVANRKPPRPTTTPNPEGASVPLSAETFQSKVTMTQEPWFIKFYAPWCHHCQALAPNWEQLGKEMKGKLNIGEVNCDVESRLCKDVRLRGYPTILFFKGGERVEYDGLRGVGDLLQYAEKAIDISSGVQDVDAATFKALEEKEEVMFVYFYDHATTSEDFMALDRLPLSLIGHAKLVKTQDPVLCDRFKITTWPRLLVSREGRPSYYPPLTPNSMRDTHQVLDWMRSAWLPIVPELTASNAREIMDGKIVVLGILNREDQEGFLGALREMKSAATEWMDKQILNFQRERQELRDAKQLRIEEAEDRGDQRALRAAKALRINMDKSDHKEVTFAWVDGVFWQRWIRTTYGIDVKDGERVIINDEDNRRYWDQTISGNSILPSRTSILETINKVTAPTVLIRPKLTISSFEKIFFDIRITFVEHPYLSAGCVLGVCFGLVSWFRGRIRRNRGNFRLDDNVKDYKAPLLGITTNGKVD